MAEQDGTIPRKVVLVDMDGTIADATRRERKYLRSGKKDWPGFFRNMENDPPIDDVLSQVKELARDNDIIILTGRPEKYRRQTEQWLERHGVKCVRVLVRRHGETR